MLKQLQEVLWKSVILFLLVAVLLERAGVFAECHRQVIAHDPYCDLRQQTQLVTQAAPLS